MTKYERHELSAIFPQYSEEDLKKLKESIQQRGLDNPTIDVFEGKILDGWNRYSACLSVPDVKLDFKVFTGSYDEALDLVTRRNLDRRHLTTSQKAMIAATLHTRKQGQKPGKTGLSAAELSTKFGISEDVLADAKKVNSSGNTELIEKVKSGEVKVSKAAKELRKKPTPTPAVVVSTTVVPEGTLTHGTLIVEPQEEGEVSEVSEDEALQLEASTKRAERQSALDEKVKKMSAELESKELKTAHNRIAELEAENMALKRRIAELEVNDPDYFPAPKLDERIEGEVDLMHQDLEITEENEPIKDEDLEDIMNSLV